MTSDASDPILSLGIEQRSELLNLPSSTPPPPPPPPNLSWKRCWLIPGGPGLSRQAQRNLPCLPSGRP